MDDRLIPPSHFDPSARDSLEVSRSSTPASLPEGRFEQDAQPYVQPQNPLLRPPDDFSPGGVHREGFIAPPPSSGKIHPRQRANYSTPQPGRYETPPQVSRNIPISAVPVGYDVSSPGISERYSDILRLQAENQALKTLIQCKKAEDAKSSKDEDDGGGGSNMRTAIIEHLTKHIARLQHELEEKSSLIAKKDSETLQFKTEVDSKSKENKSIVEEVENLQSIIKKREDKEKLLEQEIEGLQTIVRDLRKEKEDLGDSHLGNIRAVEAKLNKEKDDCRSRFEKEMEVATTRHEKAKLQWQEAMRNLEQQNKAELEAVQDNHQKEIKLTKKSMEKKYHESEEHAQQLEGQLGASKKDIQICNEMVEKEKARSKELEDTVNRLTNEVTSAKHASEKYLAQVSQLQTYIGKQLEEDYERSQWKNQKKKFEDHILELQAEKEDLNKTLELQTVRLQSVTKILTTQEEAIQANAKAFSTGSVGGNPVRVVIRKWREKVFELMIQCKSREISLKEFENKCKLAKMDLQEQLEEEKRVSVILQSRLSECQAQLEMQERENVGLSETNNRLVERLNFTTTKAAELEETVVTLSEEVAKVVGDLSKQFHDKFTSIMEKNIHLEQRIVFANNRLRTIQDLMLRRDNIWKAKLKRAREIESPVTAASPKPDEKPAECPELMAEIDRLTKERDLLSQRLNSDSAIFENAMSKFRTREVELEKKVTTMEHDNEHKSEKVASLQIQLEKYDDRMRCHQRVAEEAKENLQSVLEKHEKDVELKLGDAWQKWDAEKTELEKRLNDSQRELAKTVVTSRQSERNQIRERKRAEEALAAMNAEREVETEKLRRKMKALQQDNNLLMTTLRQQGLISAFKAARSQAAKMRSDLDTVTSDLLEKNEGSRPNSVESSPRKHGKKLCCKTDGSKPRSPRKNVTEDPHGPVPPQDESGSGGHGVADVSCASTDADQDGVAEMLKDLVVLTEDILGDSD